MNIIYTITVINSNKTHNMTPQKIKYSEHLRKLGVSKLKKEQKEIINAVLNNRDSISILPTGFGKSLTYVLPHILTKRNVLVISPLVSLIRDQEQKYKEICNTFSIYGGNLFYNGQIGIDVSMEIKNEDITSLIFMTPETLLSKKNWISSINILTIAIDECHCICEWKNFRTGYKELSTIIDWFEQKSRPSILCLTATATEKSINKITKFFQLKNPLFIRMSAERKNINISVHKKTKLKDDLKKLIELSKNKTIIYCKTRKETENLASKLYCDDGISAYHAGLNSNERSLIQDNFKNGSIRIIVATIAFGMGIDISDIHTVIHYGLPKDIESYSQEIGRAGRQLNSEAYCYLFWGKYDMFLNKLFLSKLSDTQEYKYQEKKNYAMNNFVYNSSLCRMIAMCKYFDPDQNYKNCLKCDICKKKNNIILKTK